MGSIKRLSDKEIREDMRAMFKSTINFDRTIGMMNLTDDELLIFKRAAHQLKKAQPNMLIRRRAYDIFLVKSYANTAINYHDTQAILGDPTVRHGFFENLFHSGLIKIFMAVVILLTTFKGL